MRESWRLSKQKEKLSSYTFQLDHTPRGEIPHYESHPNPAGHPIWREIHLHSIVGLLLFNSKNWLYLNKIKKERKKGRREGNFIYCCPILFSICGYGGNSQEWSHNPNKKGGKRVAQLVRSLNPLKGICNPMPAQLVASASRGNGREGLDRAKRDQM